MRLNLSVYCYNTDCKWWYENLCMKEDGRLRINRSGVCQDFIVGDYEEDVIKELLKEYEN